MDTITKEVKKFLDEYPEAPFDIKITNHSLFDDMWGKLLEIEKPWDIKVTMSVYLQPEEEDEVDGIGIEHKKTFIISKKQLF